MTPDEIKSAIERRGYTVRVETYFERTVDFRISRGEKSKGCAYSLHDLAMLKMSLSSFVESMLYTFSEGMRHMQCVQCGEPVLASFKWLYEEGKCLKWYGVCSVKAGPYTEHLSVCEGCGIEWGYPPPLKGIEDGH